MSKSILLKCFFQFSTQTKPSLQVRHLLSYQTKISAFPIIKSRRNLYVSCVTMNQKGTRKQQLMIKKFLDREDKDKENFLIAIQQFVEHRKDLRGQIDFIRSALGHLKAFGVHKDIDAYKSLIEIMPKDLMVATNQFQVMFQHYPLHQGVCVEVLEQMQKNCVMPDAELQDIIVKRFGKRSAPSFKLGRMLYWMPKMKYNSPWLLPEELPTDTYALAHLAISRIASVDPASVISTYQSSDLEDCEEDTWIISSGSPDQQRLVMEHDKTKPLKVEGPFGIYLRNFMVNYFILRGDPIPPPPVMSKREIDDVSNLQSWMVKSLEKESKVMKFRSVHDQDDGVIISVCATGTSSKDSVLAWVRHLQIEMPHLENIPILFTQTSPVGYIMSPQDLKNAAERQEKAVKEAKNKPKFQGTF